MTIKKEPEASGPSLSGGRIVIGVDGSPGSLAALRWALSEASLRGEDVHAVGVWDYPGGMNYGKSADDTSPKEVLAAALEMTIAAATAPRPGGEVSPVTTITTSVVQGDPARELQHAVGDGDLLVVGSRGHGAAVGLLLGSVSQHVVAHARCPVVVVPNLVHLEESASA
jgi:nucleotide-binding universal stress UspA family protein